MKNCNTLIFYGADNRNKTKYIKQLILIEFIMFCFFIYPHKYPHLHFRIIQSLTFQPCYHAVKDLHHTKRLQYSPDREVVHNLM